MAKTPEAKGKPRRKKDAVFFILPFNRSMVDPDDSLMHISLIVNLKSVRELYNHYKVFVLDKDERVWLLLTKWNGFHKIHTFMRGECILLGKL